MFHQRNSGQQVSPGGRSDELILSASASLDRTALGVAVGGLFGVLLLGATLLVVLQGHDRLNLGLLSRYYPGYSVSPEGALLGFLYGFVSGYILGWFIALFRNTSLRLYLGFERKRAELSRPNDFLDRI